MDPATHTSNSAPAAASSATASSDADVTRPAAAAERELRAKAEVLRSNLAEAFKQLALRWQNLSNIKAQLRQHPVATVLGGTVLFAIGGGITLRAVENRRRKSFAYRFKQEFGRATGWLWRRLH